MESEEHLTRLKQGVDAWNEWRWNQWWHGNRQRKIRPDLHGADLTRADLDGANLSGADLGGAVLREADLTKADLREADLTKADLYGANLSGADLGGAVLHGAHLTKADLRGADLGGADLRGADLSWADLTRVYLYGASLTSAALDSAHLGRADLTRVDLERAHLTRADLHGVHLRGANLRGANLTFADLRGADLREVDFFAAELSWADLRGADLRGADLGGAKIGRTMLGDVDLGAVRGLKMVLHVGHSTIGIDTLSRSNGQIPESFLRGAGVPEELITYAKALGGHPFEFYSCFISYSSKDQEFANRLHADLQSNGVHCWFAPHDGEVGRKLHEQIDEAIRRHERLLLILSPDSMTSEWVKTEIAMARQREVHEKKPVLFPVSLVSFEAIRAWECFDADIGKDSAREIREYLIPDFSNWTNYNAYQKAFAQLLHALKTGARQTRA